MLGCGLFRSRRSTVTCLEKSVRKEQHGHLLCFYSRGVRAVLPLCNQDEFGGQCDILPVGFHPTGACSQILLSQICPDMSSANSRRRSRRGREIFHPTYPNLNCSTILVGGRIEVVLYDHHKFTRQGSSKTAHITSGGREQPPYRTKLQCQDKISFCRTRQIVPSQPSTFIMVEYAADRTCLDRNGEPLVNSWQTVRVELTGYHQNKVVAFFFSRVGTATVQLNRLF